jgi:hypothetical protein
VDPVVEVPMVHLEVTERLVKETKEEIKTTEMVVVLQMAQEVVELELPERIPLEESLLMAVLDFHTLFQEQTYIMVVEVVEELQQPHQWQEVLEAEVLEVEAMH